MSNKIGMENRTLSIHQLQRHKQTTKFYLRASHCKLPNHMYHPKITHMNGHLCCDRVEDHKHVHNASIWTHQYHPKVSRVDECLCCARVEDFKHIHRIHKFAEIRVWRECTAVQYAGILYKVLFMTSHWVEILHN